MEKKKSVWQILDIIRFSVSFCLYAYITVPCLSQNSITYTIYNSGDDSHSLIYSEMLLFPLFWICFLLLCIYLKPDDPSSSVMLLLLPKVPQQCLKLTEFLLIWNYFSALCNVFHLKFDFVMIFSMLCLYLDLSYKLLEDMTLSCTASVYFIISHIVAWGFVW